MPKKKVESKSDDQKNTTSVIKEIQTSSGIQVAVTTLPGCKVTFTLTLPTEFNSSIWKEAIKLINKEVSLPGFRRGKAPEQFIVKKYPTHLNQEWKKIAAEKALQEALLATKISPLQQDASIKTSWIKSEPKESAEITYEFEARPSVPELDYKKLDITAPPLVTVTDEEFEKELEILAQRSSQQKECDTETVAAKEHWVEVKTEILESQEELYAGKRFECRDGAMPQDLLDAVQGMKAGESKEVELTDPKASSEIKVKVKLELEKVLKQETPTLDDAFAKSMGLKDLDDLKKRLRDNMQNQKNYEYEANLLDVVQKALAKGVDFELPASFVEQEKKTIQQTKSLEWQKKNQAKPEGDDLVKIEAEASEAAVERVKSLFVVHHIADQENIEVPRTQVEEMMQPYLGQLSKEKDPERLRAGYSNLYSQCHMHLLTQSALRSIASKLGLLDGVK